VKVMMLAGGRHRMEMQRVEAAKVNKGNKNKTKSTQKGKQKKC
jgi:hypothetical protein